MARRRDGDEYQERKNGKNLKGAARKSTERLGVTLSLRNTLRNWRERKRENENKVGARNVK
jgi:hypothetical protein